VKQRFNLNNVEAKEQIKRLVAEHQDPTLAELCEGFAQLTGNGVSRTAMCRGLQKLGLSRKKNEIQGYCRRNSSILLIILLRVKLIYNIPLFCHFPKKGSETLMLSLAIAGCYSGKFVRISQSDRREIQRFAR